MSEKCIGLLVMRRLSYNKYRFWARLTRSAGTSRFEYDAYIINHDKNKRT